MLNQKIAPVHAQYSYTKRYPPENLPLGEEGIQALLRDLNEYYHNIWTTVIDPANSMSIYSLRSGRHTTKGLETIKIKEIQPGQDKVTDYRMPVRSLRNAGFDDILLDEIEEEGVFFRMKTERGAFYVVPSMMFMHSLTQAIGMGRPMRGISEYRDLYLSEAILNASCDEKSLQFILYQGEGQTCKGLGCLSPDYTVSSLQDIGELLRTLQENLGTISIHSYRITPNITSIDMLFGDSKRIKETTVFKGCRLVVSENGFSACSLQPTLVANGSIILLPHISTKKKTKFFSFMALAREFLDNGKEILDNAFSDLTRVIKQGSPQPCKRYLMSEAKELGLLTKIGAQEFHKKLGDVPEECLDAESCFSYFLRIPEFFEEESYNRKKIISECMGKALMKKCS